MNCWLLFTQCVPPVFALGLFFQSAPPDLEKLPKEFFLWFLLQTQVPAFLVGCNWEGMKTLCSVFLDLDSFVLHLISSRSDPGLGCSYLKNLRDLEYFSCAVV